MEFTFICCSYGVGSGAENNKAAVAGGREVCLLREHLDRFLNKEVKNLEQNWGMRFLVDKTARAKVLREAPVTEASARHDSPFQN